MCRLAAGCRVHLTVALSVCGCMSPVPCPQGHQEAGRLNKEQEGLPSKVPRRQNVRRATSIPWAGVGHAAGHKLPPRAQRGRGEFSAGLLHTVPRWSCMGCNYRYMPVAVGQGECPVNATASMKASRQHWRMHSWWQQCPASLPGCCWHRS